MIERIDLMQQSRKAATIKNIAVAFIYNLIMIGFGFIIPRLFLTTYSPEIHGLTSSITNIMSYVMLLYAGLNTASVQALYDPLGKNDYRRINEVLNAIKKYYINTGFAFTVAVLVISLILPYFIEEIPSKTVFLMMIVMGLQSTVSSFLISTNSVLLKADQKLYISNLFNIITLILRGVIQIILIKLMLSPIVVQAIPTVILIVPMAMQKIYISKNYPMLDSSVKPDKSSLSKRWSALVHQIAGLVVNNTDVLLLIVVTGDMILVSVYSVYQLVFTHLYKLMTTVFSQGSVASFGNLITTGDLELVKKNYNIYEFIYCSFISVTYSITAVLILPFVSLYTRGVLGVNYVDYKLAILFVLIGIVNNLRVPGGTMINAGGYYKETQWRASLEAGINLFVSLLLVKPLGIYGLLIGTVCSFSYRTTDIILFSNKYILKKSAKVTFLRAIRVFAVVIMSTFTFNKLLTIDIVSWQAWFLTAIKVGLFSLVLTGISSFVFDSYLFKKLSRLIKKIIKNVYTRARKAYY